MRLFVTDQIYFLSGKAPKSYLSMVCGATASINESYSLVGWIPINILSRKRFRKSNAFCRSIHKFVVINVLTNGKLTVYNYFYT